ncbi:MAG: RHS repeat-associated core domain-containing protein [Candidatus Izemoplasmatales bacterium]
MDRYYLNSRYYTPEVGRFINADGLLGQVGDILSTNMYTYCANNPVMYLDSDGYSWTTFWKVAGGLAVAAVAVVIVVATGGGALVAVAAAGAGYLLGSNVATVVESEIYINNSDVSTMDKDKAESILRGNNTTGLSREEKLSFILYLQNQYSDQYSDWTTGQMLREFEYHDRLYNSLTSLRFDSNINGNWFEQQVYRAQYVDFETTQTPKTYFRRILGNAWPFGE